jgi:hypothetical protein
LRLFSALDLGKLVAFKYGDSADLLTKQDRHICFLGLREIHQKHLLADLVFLINERKTTLRIFLYFSVGCGLKSLNKKDKYPKVVWISMTVWGRVNCYIAK